MNKTIKEVDIMCWFDFNNDYVYCTKCGAVLKQDYIKLGKMKFCDEDCLEHFIESTSIVYPYGVYWDDEMYQSMDILMDKVYSMVEYVSYELVD